MSERLSDIVCIGAARTPTGSFGGSLRDLPAYDIGGAAIKEAMNRAGVEGKQVSEVIYGCCRQAGVRTNPARTAAIRAQIPYYVPANTVNMACPSGMKATILASQALRLGDAEIIVSGGMESMSRIPYFIENARWEPFKLGDKKITDGWNDNIDPTTGQGMGITAENVSEKYGISRQEQDEFSLLSQTRVKQAQESGWFDQELFPIEVPAKKKKPAFTLDKDETNRPDSTLEKLSRLRPVFKEGGVVTAGNSCGMSDGASALVMTTREKAMAINARPLFSILGYASAAVENHLMGEGPGVSIPRALEKAGLSLGDVDLVEINEAFAAQVLANLKVLELDVEKVNIAGGAIALGHPVGSSGSRILVTLYYQMKRTGGELGVAGICGGTGVTCAMVIKREL
ncbi:MAG: thiolase family protein [Deltaproteobacteria bacterium]|nr:thiolase family protein [Deltaproteobacteria bacterium]